MLSNKDWTIHHQGTGPRATLPDGSKSGYLVMRRRVNGEWEYRIPTAEEETDYISDEIW